MRCLVGLGMVIGCADVPVPSDGVHLSTEGLYADIAGDVIAAGAIELSPAYPLWSDGAAKRRWIVLPPGGVIDTSDMDHWELPVGTKLFKEFVVGGRRVETRLIERVGPAEYRFVPYAWLADESDALAAPEGATDVHGTTHDIPAQETCLACHVSEPGRALGVSTIQLADSLDGLPLSHEVPRVVLPDAALGVLHGNCGHCHAEGGIAPMQTLRFGLADAYRPLEQTAPYRTTVGAPTTVWHGAAYRIVPGDPDASAIAIRMASRAPEVQMPPLATERVDEAGLAAVRAWIAALR